jgi:hypothetical protein
VNPASSIATFVVRFRGTEPTSLTQSFPGRPGLSEKLLAQTFVPASHLVLSMNCDEATRNHGAVNQIISTELFTMAGNAIRASINVHALVMRPQKVVHRRTGTENPRGE